MAARLTSMQGGSEGEPERRKGGRRIRGRAERRCRVRAPRPAGGQCQLGILPHCRQTRPRELSRNQSCLPHAARGVPCPSCAQRRLSICAIAEPKPKSSVSRPTSNQERFIAPPRRPLSGCFARAVATPFHRNRGAIRMPGRRSRVLEDSRRCHSRAMVAKSRFLFKKNRRLGRFPVQTDASDVAPNESRFTDPRWQFLPYPLVGFSR
jgi:hypothetical protein